MAEALAAPQVAARDMVVTLDHPTIGPLRQTGLPLKFSMTPGGPATAPPRHGEHTDAVLRKFCGVDPVELAALREAGIIGG